MLTAHLAVRAHCSLMLISASTTSPRSLPAGLHSSHSSPNPPPGLSFPRGKIWYLSLIHVTEGVDMLTYNLEHLCKHFVVPCAKELFICTIRSLFLENRSHPASFPTAHPSEFTFPLFTYLACVISWKNKQSTIIRKE